MMYISWMKNIYEVSFVGCLINFLFILNTLKNLKYFEKDRNLIAYVNLKYLVGSSVDQK